MTADNASNNGTLIATLAEMLTTSQDLAVPLDEQQANIRCLPHVIHLAVSDGLEELKANVEMPDRRGGDAGANLAPMSISEAEEAGSPLAQLGMADWEIEQTNAVSGDYASPWKKVCDKLCH
jgi:hypothetical protein